jgi:hypothetical protein
MHIVVNETDDQKRVEDAIKQFEETQKEKDKVTQENLRFNKTVQADKNELKNSIITI